MTGATREPLVGLAERDVQALRVQNGAYRTLNAHLEAEIKGHRARAQEYYLACQTLDSEREANAILTTALEEQSRRVEDLEAALRWALPLAERAVDDHRMLRLQCGHSDITGTYKNGVTWVGIHQSEVDQIERARTALSPSDTVEKGEGA